VPAVAVSGDGNRLALAGVLDIRTLAAAENSLTQRLRQRKSRVLDLGNLSGLDSPGALFLCTLRDKGVELTGVRDEHKALLDLICGLDLKPLPRAASVPRWREVIIGLARAPTMPGATRSMSSPSSAERRARRSVR
jgi:ABC-type transporter Mla MlaB component